MSDGASQRDHLLAVERMGGPRDALLDIPADPPSQFIWIWMVFHELNGGRQFNKNHPQRLSHQEIQSWVVLTGEKLKKRELRILRELDVVWINTTITMMQESS